MPEAMVDISRDRLCLNCGYNLRGLEKARCPECGSPFDPKRLDDARIPWLRRQAMSGWSAYWRTVYQIMFQPRTFAQEVWDAPRVDIESATRFRWIVVFQNLALAELALFSTMRAPRSSHDLAVALMVALILAIVVLIFLLGATSLATFNVYLGGEELWRGTLLNNAAAPLTMTPLAALLYALLQINADLARWAVVIAIIVLVIWWWVASVLMLRVTHQSINLTVASAIFMPVWWGVCAVVALLCGIGIGTGLFALIGFH